MGIFFGWIILPLIAGAKGSERKSGFAGSFFSSLLLSPLLGFIFTAASTKLSDEKHQKTMEVLMEKTPIAYELAKMIQLHDEGKISAEEPEA